MGIEIRCTCDKCGKEVPYKGTTHDADLWRVAFVVSHHAHAASPAYTRVQELWCRTCVITTFGTIACSSLNIPRADIPILNPQEALYRAIRELIAEEISDAQP